MHIKAPIDLDKEFHYDIEYLKYLSKDYIKNFKNQLESHPNYSTLKDNFIINENSIMHILQKTPKEELKNLSEEERYFYPLCTKEEIDKVFSPKTAKDYLLKLRAENISDNIRLHRVFISIRKSFGESWNFSDYIDSRLFEEYLDFLPSHLRKQCEIIPHGVVHLRDANGFCMKTPKGNILVVSEALQYFLYYMNLFMLGGQLGVPEEDISASFWIAIRTMLGFESLDFEVDPRGKLPNDVHLQIKNSTEWQLRFIIGHEYAHHYLNHLENGVISELNFHSDIKKSSDVKRISYSHQKEYDADLFSIKSIETDDMIKDSMTIAGLYFFHFLDLLETVTDYMLPSGRVDTHPKAIDRLWNLRNSIDDKYGVSKSELESYLNSYKSFKEHIISEILPFKTELIESYSSMYLPSHMESMKIDRLDY
jgi:hypothetical protein